MKLFKILLIVLKSLLQFKKKNEKKNKQYFIIRRWITHIESCSYFAVLQMSLQMLLQMSLGRTIQACQQVRPQLTLFSLISTCEIKGEFEFFIQVVRERSSDKTPTKEQLYRAYTVLCVHGYLHVKHPMWACAVDGQTNLHCFNQV